MLVGIALIALEKIAVGAILPILVFVAIGVFIGVKSPYKKSMDNIRQISNMVITILILAIYLVYKTTGKSSTNNFYLFLPAIICLLLIACVCYNGAAIIHRLYKLLKGGNI
jgi:phosphotransferase system  glucose/maltose/N-acetylglucosamine-specific IIC component